MSTCALLLWLTLGGSPALDPAPAVAATPVAPAPAPSRRPRRGTGMFVTTGILFGAAGIIQLADVLPLGDSMVGLGERGLLAGAGITAAIGFDLRARSDARADHAAGEPRDLEGKLGAGIGLLVAGVVAGAINEALWWTCVTRRAGPVWDGEFGGCWSGPSRIALDVAAVTAGTGLGLTVYVLRYRHEGRRLAFVPNVARGGLGLALGGRF